MENCVACALREEHIPEIVTLWNSNFDPCFHVDKAILLNKILYDAELFRPGTFVFTYGGKIVGLIATKLSRNGPPEFTDCGWISALLVDAPYRRKGLGRHMYLTAENELKKAGVKKIMAAGELNNIFSGIPSPSLENMQFFAGLGFYLNDDNHYDVTADVSAIDFERLTVKKDDSPAFVTKPFSEGDGAKLNRFLHQEFPGRWQFEVMRYLEQGGDPGQVLLLCRDQEIKGFSKIQISHGGGIFAEQLGDFWGTLGPIGISKDLRGTGLGSRILFDALHYLKKQGTRNVNIDWTVLTGFYGKFGFVPWRTYRGAYKYLCVTNR